MERRSEGFICRTAYSYHTLAAILPSPARHHMWASSTSWASSTAERDVQVWRVDEWGVNTSLGTNSSVCCSSYACLNFYQGSVKKSRLPTTHTALCEGVLIVIESMWIIQTTTGLEEEEGMQPSLTIHSITVSQHIRNTHLNAQTQTHTLTRIKKDLCQEYTTICLDLRPWRRSYKEDDSSIFGEFWPIGR